MVQFSAPQKIAALINNVITAAVPPMPDHASMPNAPTKVSAKNDPSVHKSPCAKLISSIIPYTMVYPMAINAIIIPFETPVISCCERTSLQPMVTCAPATEVACAVACDIIMATSVSHIEPCVAGFTFENASMRYLPRTLTNLNSPFSTVLPLMVVLVVSPFSSKLQIPSAPL